MIIDKAEIIVTSPDRNFVTLRLTTDDGLVGIGDATLNGRELAVVAYLKEHVAQLLIGRDASRIEDTWQFLYRSAYWRRGPVTMAAIAAVDMALWDIKGKAAGMPVYQLLGGASRNGLMAYGHASGKTNEELFDSIRAHQEQGYRSIRVQTGVPGLKSIYGIASHRRPSRRTPACATTTSPRSRGALPAEEDWDTRAYLRHMPTVFEAVRNEFGPELPLLHDGHHRMTPIQAAKLGKSLEPYDLFWLEDCTPAENQEALRLVRQHTTTPLAIGEIFNTVWDYQQIIREQLIDYVRGAVTHTGGISHLKKTARLRRRSTRSSRACTAPPTSRRSAWPPRCTSDCPSTTSASRSTCSTARAPNEVFQQTFTWSDGYLHPGDEPGLGVTLDVDEAGKYPYEQAYLPYNRLADGTVHDW